MAEQSKLKNSLFRFLRLNSNSEIKWTIMGIIIGTIAYIVLSQLILPSHTFFGLDLGITVIPITGGIYLGLVIIVLVAALHGPLAGFLVGFLGPISSEILFTQQIVAMGMVSFSFAILGLIVGIPNYSKNEGFSNGKNLGKLLLLTLLGYLLMTIFYLISLIVIAGASFEGTLLYNFAPYFSVTILSLFVFAPIFVRVLEIVVNESKKYWESRSVAG